MYIKLIGAGLILAGCGGCGIRIAFTHRREVSSLRQLSGVLDVMLCELEYRLTPLPELCRIGAEYASGVIGEYFSHMARLLDAQYSPDVKRCAHTALTQIKNVPMQTALELENLGQTLGRFDLQGQMNALQQCRSTCLNRLEKLEHQQDRRLRSYQTLGFCAGAALAILLF